MKEIGILFDLDGTLLDTLQDLADSTNFVLRQHGLPERSLKEIRRFVGNGAGRLIQRALPGREDDPDWRQVLEEFQAYYSHHCQIKTKPYEGILEALEELGRKYPIAIVSNKPDVAVKPLCGQYFPGIYAQGETSDCPRKPAPDMVYRAMEAIGVKSCIYVGDSEVDVQTARNAGAACLSVLWGFRDREEMEAEGSVYFCSDPAQLPRMLKEMENEIHGE